MIEEGPDAQAEMCQDATGVRTVAGKDLMVLDVGEDLELSQARTYDGEWIPEWAPKLPEKYRDGGQKGNF